MTFMQVPLFGVAAEIAFVGLFLFLAVAVVAVIMFI